MLTLCALKQRGYHAREILACLADRRAQLPQHTSSMANRFMAFTIQQAFIPSPDGYQTADIRIEGEEIAAIAPQLDPVGTVVDGRDRLLLPGFVNAHTHSLELWQRGLIPPLPLELWLEQLYASTPTDPEWGYLAALGTAAETLLSGGTTVVDHLILIPGRERESIAAAVRAYREIGIRAVVAPLVQDEAPGSDLPGGTFPRKRDTSGLGTDGILALLAEAVETYRDPAGSIEIAVAPTGVQLCSDDLFRGAIALSDRFGLKRHTHLMETQAQQRLAWEKYGCSGVEHLERLGFLSDRTSLAHCVWLDDNDIEILARTRATVVHNPLSNLRLGSGIAPILKYRQAGVNVTFGCDGSASNDAQNVLEAIKIGSLLHNVTDFDYRHWISPREAIAMAALGGARGLALDNKIGSLEVGKQADLVLYDLGQWSLLPRTDPVGLLVRGRPDAAVREAWVRGDRLVANGTLTRIDFDELRRQLYERSAWISRHSLPQALPLEKRYRQVMQLGDRD